MPQRTRFLALTTSLAVALLFVSAALLWQARPRRIDPSVPVLVARAEDRDAITLPSAESVAALGDAFSPETLDRKIAPATLARRASEVSRLVDTAHTGKQVTRLYVLVRAKEDGEPQVGVRVWATYSDEGNARKTIQGQQGDLPVTDARGLAELDVEPGRALDVLVCDARMRNEKREIAALAAGEERVTVFEFPTAEDVRLFGQLVAAEDGAPLQGTVTVIEGAADGRVVDTDSSGCFKITAGSWDHAFACAEVEGRAQVVFPIANGYEDRSGLRVVRLARASSVRAFVCDRNGAPVEGASVELRCSYSRLVQATSLLIDATSRDDRVWRGRTDSSGCTTIEDLPSMVPLLVSVSKSGFPRHDQPEPIRLEIGEQHELDVLLGAGATILGSLQDETGAPIRGRSVWRMPAEAPVPGMFRAYSIAEETVETTKTDANGRFRFAAVPTGTWWIGPAPVDSSDIPPVAQPVIVTDERAEMEIVVRVERGLYLRGRVLDAVGFPVGDRLVSAKWIGGHADASDSSKEDGTFALGPLVAGRWSVYAQGNGAMQASSPLMEVESGSSDLALFLRAGGQILGEVVDGRTGEHCWCELAWGRIDAKPGDAWQFWTIRQSVEGNIRLEGLLPGTYVLTARTRDGRIAARKDIVVESGATVDGLRLELTQGAKLGLRYEGDSPIVHCRVFVAGTMVDSHSFEAGKIETMVVPSGAIVVRWSESSSPVEHVESLTLESGEERPFAFGRGSTR